MLYLHRYTLQYIQMMVKLYKKGKFLKNTAFIASLLGSVRNIPGTTYTTYEIRN